MSDEHFAKLAAMYLSAPCNEIYKPSITVQKGIAQVSLSVKPHMFHAAGAMHGSVYFKMLDDAAFFAVNSLVDDLFVLTCSFNCYFLKPVTSGMVTAEGKVKNVTSKLFVAESVMTNTSGEAVARGSGTFMRSRIALTPEMGYKL